MVFVKIRGQKTFNKISCFFFPLLASSPFANALASFRRTGLFTVQSKSKLEVWFPAISRISYPFYPLSIFFFFSFLSLFIYFAGWFRGTIRERNRDDWILVPKKENKKAPKNKCGHVFLNGSFDWWRRMVRWWSAQTILTVARPIICISLFLFRLSLSLRRW